MGTLKRKGKAELNLNKINRTFNSVFFLPKLYWVTLKKKIRRRFGGKVWKGNQKLEAGKYNLAKILRFYRGKKGYF